jgi:hypothetical protein
MQAPTASDAAVEIVLLILLIDALLKDAVLIKLILTVIPARCRLHCLFV